MLKSFITLLILLFAQSKPLLAETWIKVATFYKDGGIKYDRWIDVKSIVQRGDWVYANMKLKSDRGKGISPIKINCKERVFQYADYPNSKWERKQNGIWKAAGKEYDSPGKEGAYDLLCKEYRRSSNLPFFRKIFSD